MPNRRSISFSQSCPFVLRCRRPTHSSCHDPFFQGSQNDLGPGVASSHELSPGSKRELFAVVALPPTKARLLLGRRAGPRMCFARSGECSSALRPGQGSRSRRFGYGLPAWSGRQARAGPDAGSSGAESVGSEILILLGCGSEERAEVFAMSWMLSSVEQIFCISAKTISARGVRSRRSLPGLRTNSRPPSSASSFCRDLVIVDCVTPHCLAAHVRFLTFAETTKYRIS